jgi:nicotine blue oxidoreductase
VTIESVEERIAAKRLDGLDRVAHALAREKQASEHGRAIDQHGARAAVSLVAALFGPYEIQIDVMHGIVLAAGSGGRMGGSKARLIIEGMPLVEAHVRRMRDAGCSGVVIVVRDADADVVPAGAIVAISGAPDPAGSLRIGLEKVPAGEERIAITPVDVLPARVPTLRALACALDREGIVAASPVHGGRGGHPVVVQRSALALREGQSLHDLLVSLGHRRERIELDDPAVTSDLDIPEDVIALTGLAPRFLPSPGR